MTYLIVGLAAQGHNLGQRSDSKERVRGISFPLLGSVTALIR